MRWYIHQNHRRVSTLLLLFDCKANFVKKVYGPSPFKKSPKQNISPQPKQPRVSNTPIVMFI
ncbi:hypothetical protein HanRHA438_Chr14g0647921 [Helianthus annuus]|nr:hypothetical protein HanIR_Chr14g0691541 [Helianthus annuus]KAJ0853154.1 hypothetical protein HanRHA438_Chr14g0647921 [Helianthus annuus]